MHVLSNSHTNGDFNPLNAELNTICYLLALLGTHHFLHVSRIRVNVDGDEFKQSLLISLKFKYMRNSRICLNYIERK